MLPSYDVVIPCFNRAAYVAEAVRSVLGQCHAAARIVVVDDGSTDGSRAVASRLAADHPVIRSVASPCNEGVSAARNLGATQGSAEWIAFLDSDDVWLPGGAAALLGDVDHRCDVIVGRFARSHSGGFPGNPESGYRGGDVSLALRAGQYIGMSWSMVRRSTFDRIGGFDPGFRVCEDWDFWDRVARSGAEFRRSRAIVALYRTVAGDRLMADQAALTAATARILARASYEAPRRAA